MPTSAQSGAPPRDRAGRTALFVVPFSAADDSAVTWAVAEFDKTGQRTLFVFHPDPNGVPIADLAELRDRFASHLAGRYRVLVGHPHDPATWAGATARPFPALLFVRAD